MLQQVVGESPLYQEIMQLGEERGLKLGEERGKLEGLREAVLDLYADRAPELVDAARTFISALNDQTQLRALLRQVSQAQDVARLRELLGQ